MSEAKFIALLRKFIEQLDRLESDLARPGGTESWTDFTVLCDEFADLADRLELREAGRKFRERQPTLEQVGGLGHQAMALSLSFFQSQASGRPYTPENAKEDVERLITLNRDLCPALSDGEMDYSGDWLQPTFDRHRVAGRLLANCNIPGLRDELFKAAIYGDNDDRAALCNSLANSCAHIIRNGLDDRSDRPPADDRVPASRDETAQHFLRIVDLIAERGCAVGRNEIQRELTRPKVDRSERSIDGDLNTLCRDWNWVERRRGGYSLTERGAVIAAQRAHLLQ